jgi:Putative beta-barrel porin-2, OmpL-like. bbp2
MTFGGMLPVIVLVALARNAQAQPSPEPPSPTSNLEWQVGGFLDLGYLDSFNSPSNHLFRSRGTTPRVDELNVNIGGGYIRSLASESSRWGLELTVHAGEDSKVFGFSATAPNIGGADWLLHLGPTNVSYLAPTGGGLTLQAGIFSSFIGYDSLYAKDNFTYTRPWTADFTPYLMLGVNAGYTVTDGLTVTGFVLNGYWHLAHANDVPSFGGQLAYKPTDGVTVKETVLYGPHQENTDLSLWRFLSNTIVERKTDRFTAAFDFDVSSEIVDSAERPRAWWVAGQLPVHWAIEEPWSVTVRPEFAWDSHGRWTTFEQSVRAITSTLEYRARLRQAQAILRIEHRYDHSTGSGGGFYQDVQPGVVGLTPGQHLLVFGAILSFDATFGR